MADTLEIYGIEFPNSTGIKATDNNGVVQTYIKPQGTKSITENGTADVTNYASVDVNVSSGGAFVVTATFTNNEWSTLDKTFAQIQSAYSQGLTIEVSAFDTYAYMQCGTWCKYDNEADMFLYSVSWFDYQDTGYQFVDTYIMTSTETVLDDRQEYGTPTTLVQKTITANGTYNPILTDYADGYSLVTVNVPGGGASNIVTGTFTGTTTGSVLDVPLNYSGSGYPIAMVIYPTGGAYNQNATSGNAYTWYNLVQRYAIATLMSIKNDPSQVPFQGITNKGTVATIYKSDATSPTTYQRTSDMNRDMYTSETINPYASSTGAAVFKTTTKLSVFIADTSYGFAANIEYTYHIIYSS